ncbi:MAG: ArsJ-associated glyceraldehyde-3-phosphate dehydrogenase [Magnetococcales bacterium]|nr:ArsJ-associated glyceraldehyde-3-phosphate dehydrogenase [Magnetococcales bacterium]
MAIRVGINGFGRMGRLGLRAGWGWPEFEFVHINEIKGDAECAAHLLAFDSVHGRWNHETACENDAVIIEGQRISYSQESQPGAVDWKGMGVDLVLECSGKFKTLEALKPYFDQGVKKVLVAAPVKDEAALNVVMGIIDHLYEPDNHHIVTASSCTTNCLAPVVKVILETFGIKHGCMTTIHDITNTQTIVDLGHKDLRRARACGMSLIPTTSGSATAITQIFPELIGKINGLAVRVPLLNASLTDFVFELDRSVTVEEVNGALREAAEGPLKGVLGYEERPLVSIDYTNDPRSGIVDAPSTQVIDGTMVKLLVWYDNEWGYVNRMMELARKMSKSM